MPAFNGKTFAGTATPEFSNGSNLRDKISHALDAGYLAMLTADLGHAQETVIQVDASKVMHHVSRLLTGACIEDVNHEIYGGLYSQMIFGESFQEPPIVSSIKGFKSYEGEWKVDAEGLHVSAGRGNKLIAEAPIFSDCEVSFDVKFADSSPGNAGLILHVSKPANGADRFFGYEMSLDPSIQTLRLGRHRNNWEHISDVPCEVKIGRWINLKVRLTGTSIEILIDDEIRHTFEDHNNQSLTAGQIGLRQWERAASFRNLKVSTNANTEALAFEPAPSVDKRAISGMWQEAATGTAVGEFRLVNEHSFVGHHSQIIRFVEGEGSIGLTNAGLNRWGLHFEGNKVYEGVIYAKSETPCELWLSAESRDGTTTLAATSVTVNSSKWSPLRFGLKPKQSMDNGTFSMRLKSPGAVSVGYVSLHPGSWGRFKDLPVRRDVAEMLVQQGITILRYGGSMINNDQYRWKNMIGRREERPPYRGHWYPYSTNGWGIIDFMNFCETAGFEYVPTFGMHESPEEMADFVRYATDPSDSEWGRRRASDGHPEPFQLKYLELGNEERIDDAYVEKFKSLANAIWTMNPKITLVVGDSVYDELITDPEHVTGAASGITSLNGQRKLLQFAKEKEQEIWFDVHVWTGGPRPNRSFDAMFTYIDALECIADGACFKVLTFEFNANNHDQRRALANALAINAIERDGRLPIATSANCLQPDGQNDNGWDQGLLFLSPTNVWLQPPGYVTQMYSNHFCPKLVQCNVTDASHELFDSGFRQPKPSNRWLNNAMRSIQSQDNCTKRKRDSVKTVAVLIPRSRTSHDIENSG